jgi:DNA modification methylase
MATTSILIGDVRDRLREMPAESVHCVVTSPPYWGLRNYGVDGQIGLEATLSEHIEILVDVFREVRRVLRKDGTCWVNYGDAYCTGTTAPRPATTTEGDHVPAGWSNRNQTVRSGTPKGLKTKDRMLLPARVAIALCDDGWWLRDEIIWHKPNPMPSSVKDRTTPAHEMIYMLSKSPRYYYDQEAVLEPCSANTHARLSQDVQNQVGSNRANGGTRADRPMKAVRRSDKQQQIADAKPDGGRTIAGFNDRWDAKERKLAEAGSGIKNNGSFDAAMAIMPLMRNPRSVWTIPPKGFKGAHFATFPPDLVRPCILAGCPVGGTVLDPFFGAGTTGLVAAELGRNCIGIELNPEYAAIARTRLGLDAPVRPIPKLHVSEAALAAEAHAFQAIRDLQTRWAATGGVRSV